MHVLRTSVATAIVLAAAGALAAPPSLPPATTDPTKVPSGTYTVNGQHSQVIFQIMHLGVSPYYGRISKASGTLTLDAAHPEKSTLTVDMDMSTVSTTVSALDGEVAGPEGFNVAQFPKATFVSTAIHRTGAKSADITGNLTFHGVTKPVTLHAAFTGAMQAPWANNAWEIGFAVTGNITRSEFGMTAGKWMGVSDEVSLMIEGEFGQKL